MQQNVLCKVGSYAVNGDTISVKKNIASKSTKGRVSGSAALQRHNHK